jgi:UDP-glucose 4-epimerase
MKVLVTGGAGFIGRWVVKKLLDDNHQVIALDNLSNGQKTNIDVFQNNQNFEFIKGDILDNNLIQELFNKDIDLCIHLAAQIEVQESLENTKKPFENNVIGTYNILEAAKKRNTKVTLIGTCMVYDIANLSKAIDENHPVKPASPYAGSKLAAENLALSYHLGIGLPVTILRPFNTYGPFQKTNMEGGVVSIFIKRNLNNETLNIFGKGTQTRDLLYVEDCAEFIVKATMDNKATGHIINAGLGKDITINELAYLICKDNNKIKHIPHHHPQSEIAKLQCDSSKAKQLLGWEPKTNLEEGIKKTEEWIRTQI